MKERGRQQKEQQAVTGKNLCLYIFLNTSIFVDACHRSDEKIALSVDYLIADSLHLRAIFDISSFHSLVSPTYVRTL